MSKINKDLVATVDVSGKPGYSADGTNIQIGNITINNGDDYRKAAIRIERERKRLQLATGGAY
jgi:hypothetical protein